jgi:hypothetical protein
MKTASSLRYLSVFRAGVLLSLFWLLCAPLLRAQPFQAGSIVTTNFAMQNRLLWTNDNGQVFTPSNSLIHLSDFEGKIVFLIFFDVW